MGSDSLRKNKVQPIEVCGEERAKRTIIELLSTCGWEPLDCGGVEDGGPLCEPRGPKRKKHPRIVEYDQKHGLHWAHAFGILDCMRIFATVSAKLSK